MAASCELAHSACWDWWLISQAVEEETNLCPQAGGSERTTCCFESITWLHQKADTQTHITQDRNFSVGINFSESSGKCLIWNVQIFLLFKLVSYTLYVHTISCNSLFKAMSSTTAAVSANN